MIQRILLVIATAGLIAACAAPQRPKFQYPAGTRIGVVNYLEDFATYRHFSSLRIGNFTKKLRVNWNLPAFMEGKLSRILQADSRYVVVPIQPAEGAAGGDNRWLDSIDPLSVSDRVEPEVAGFLKAVAAKKHLDVVVIIKSFRGPSAFSLDKHPIELQDTVSL